MPGALNPSDLVSKPKPSRDYVNNLFWLHGPNYLRIPAHSWMPEYNLDYVSQNQTLSDMQNNDYYKELKHTDMVQVFLAQYKHSKNKNLSTRLKVSSLLTANNNNYSSVLASTPELGTGLTKIFGGHEPSGIYQVIYRCSNFDTILNVVAQYFMLILSLV